MTGLSLRLDRGRSSLGGIVSTARRSVSVNNPRDDESEDGAACHQRTPPGESVIFLRG